MKHRQITRHYADIAVKVHDFRSTCAFDGVTNNVISSYAVNDDLFTFNTIYMSTDSKLSQTNDNTQLLSAHSDNVPEDNDHLQQTTDYCYYSTVLNSFNQWLGNWYSLTCLIFQCTAYQSCTSVFIFVPSWYALICIVECNNNNNRR